MNMILANQVVNTRTADEAMKELAGEAVHIAQWIETKVLST
jgi:hypothetical protein